MFYSLTGTVAAVGSSFAAISCGGVAFRCNTSLNTLKRIGSVGTETTLYTYLSVREDAMELFGFDSTEELSCFKLLIGVNGVGPKAAIAILSELSPDRLAFCIATGASVEIRKAQGVGPKIAQRIVLELKDKISKDFAAGQSGSDFSPAGQPSASESSNEAVTALEVLGYSRSEAERAIAKADESLGVEEKIKFALKYLSRG